MSDPRAAVAASGMNLAGQPIGFLQPIFSGAEGDNQSYVQRLAGYQRVAGFDPITHPETGIVRFAKPAEAVVGGEAIWAFRFPQEDPLVAPWSRFRDLLAARIAEPVLDPLPLLRFDIVETLDLELIKPEVYGNAYRAYQRLSEAGAERWRNRTIVEPVLLDTARQIGIDLHLRLPLRVLQNGMRFAIEVPNTPSREAIEALQARFLALVSQYPALFPAASELEVRLRAHRVDETPRKRTDVTIILVGKLTQRQSPLPLPFAADLNVRLVYAQGGESTWIFEHFEASPLTLVLAVSKQWRLLAQAGLALSEHHPVLVTIGSSNEALLSDFEIQSEAGHIATIGLFSPASASAKGDPLVAVRPLIELFAAHGIPGASLPVAELLPARHCALVRHTTRYRNDPQEIACLLAARALRSGAVPGARGTALIDIDLREAEPPSVDFAPLFDVELRRGAVVPAGESRQMVLLVARDQHGWEPHQHSMTEGTARLLEMRGWQVDAKESWLEIGTPDRRFTTHIIEGREDVPAEDGPWQAPALGRATVLVIHIHPRREALLAGNCGQHLHIGLNDIALMQPGTQWIWPVLRRLLFGTGRLRSTAALRLLAALGVEALRSGHYQVVNKAAPLRQIEAMLASRDNERFLDFMPDGLSAREAVLYVRSPINTPAPLPGEDSVLRIRIKNDGPMLIIG